MDPIQALTLGGAAGALLYIINLLAAGKFHTDSEVRGLKQDKAELLKLNRSLTEALRRSNEEMAKMVKLLEKLLEGQGREES